MYRYRLLRKGVSVNGRSLYGTMVMMAVSESLTIPSVSCLNLPIEGGAAVRIRIGSLVGAAVLPRPTRMRRRGPRSGPWGVRL